MKRIVKYSTILIILTIMSAGCYPTGPRTVENIDDIQSEAAKINNFSLSLTLPENTPSELPEVTTDAMLWEKDELLELLGKGRTIAYEKEYDLTLSEEKIHFIEFDDGATLSFEPALLSFDMVSGSSIDSICSGVQSCISIVSNYYESYNLTFVDEIEGFPKSDAINRAKELAEKLGITNLGEPSVLGLTHQDAEYFYNNEYWDYDDFELKEWTEDDDVYFISFPLLFNGIPAETNEKNSEKAISPHSRIDVIVTRNHIIELECKSVVSPEHTNGRTIKINYSASDILKRIVSDNSKMQLKDAVDYYDCELTYAKVEWLPSGECKYIPVWRFDYTKTVDFGGVWQKLRKHEFYDVETGNKIL